MDALLCETSGECLVQRSRKLNGAWFINRLCYAASEPAFAEFDGCPIRLGFVISANTTPRRRGGIETYVQTLARAQARLGASVRVVCVNHANRAGKDMTGTLHSATATSQEQDESVSVTRIGRMASVARFDYCPGIATALKSILAWPADVIHLQTPNPAMLLAVSRLRESVPLVVTHHSDVIKQRVLRYALAPFEHSVYDRADCLIATSEAYIGGSALLTQFRSKVQIVPLGLDLTPMLDPTETAKAHAAKWRARCTVPMWLAVGRCVYYKGLGTAIAALQHVPGALVIIGTGPLQKPLENLAKQLGVADRIIWHGHANRDELIGAYLASTALWFPSSHRSEAFGLVQVEAMAAGCPVINTAIPFSGVDWVSKNDESGLTVPIGDAVALASAARRLLDEPGLRDRLSTGAVRRAKLEFDDRVMARRTMAVYDSIMPA